MFLVIIFVFPLNFQIQYYVRRTLLYQEPDDDSPITEYELWRARELEYNSIIEQLQIPFVEIVLRMYKNEFI